MSDNKKGQSLIETCIALGIICLIFMSLFQISQLFAGREILYYAAQRGARAKSVGFNWWMVTKSIRVASIPNAGKMIYPSLDNADSHIQNIIRNSSQGEIWEEALTSDPASAQYNIERARIPEYLNSENSMRAAYILNYSDWDTINAYPTIQPGPNNTFKAVVSVSQNYPLRIPLHRTFYRGDSIQMNAIASIENHYDLYVDDYDW